MYTLRTIDPKEGVPQNIYMGLHYSVIDSERSPVAFKETARLHGLANVDDIHAIVLDQNLNYWTVYKKHHAFIVTESGKTFERLN